MLQSKCGHLQLIRIAAAAAAAAASHKEPIKVPALGLRLCVLLWDMDATLRERIALCVRQLPCADSRRSQKQAFYYLLWMRRDLRKNESIYIFFHILYKISSI